MNEIKFGGFAPHIELGKSNDGDPRSKELWELWGKVAEAEKAHRDANERRGEADRAYARARHEVQLTEEKLRTAYAALEAKLGLRPKPSEGVPER